MWTDRGALPEADAGEGPYPNNAIGTLAMRLIADQIRSQSEDVIVPALAQLFDGLQQMQSRKCKAGISRSTKTLRLSAHPTLDMYTMYPSHLVHLPSQPSYEGRHFSSSTAESMHVMNGDYAQRKNFLYSSHSAINVTNHSGLVKHMVPIHSTQNGKTFYNTSKRDNWTQRSHNKKRFHHSSAPCLRATISDESEIDARSHSSKQSQSKDEIQPRDDSSDKSSQSGDKNARLNEVQKYSHVTRPPAGDRRTPDIPVFPPKRRVNYSRNSVSYRTRRVTNNLILNMHSPFPQSALFTPFCTAPDRFFLRAHLMEVKHIPEELSDGSIWDQLSHSVWKLFLKNQQSEDTYRRKMALWKYLFVLIKNHFPKYGLYLVGSTMNGFGSECSDVDMCLLIRLAEVDQRNEALSYLSDILKLLQHCEFVEKLKLIQAKVPLLKFRDRKQGLLVDLNCNNSVGIRNTHLLYCYGQMDWRVKPLVIVIKMWAQCHNINDAKNMTVSSYSLALMVIHFLQCGVSPKVLPCLHSLYKDKFNSTTDINSIDIHEELDPYQSENVQPLGELLLQFFQYYSAFNFLQYAISVRLASIIPIEECRNLRTAKNDPHQWKYLCIEEPFDQTNTARSVFDPDKFEHIRNLIIRSAHALMQTKSLDSIFKLNGPTG